MADVGKRGPQGGVEMAKMPVGRQIPEEGHFIKEPAGKKGPNFVPPTVAPAAATWMKEVDEYLEAKGWEMTGVSESGTKLWRDPEGSRLNGEEFREIILSVNKETGRPDVVRQKVLPPIPWEYSTMDALRHQKQRDMWDSESLTPLQRLEKLESKHNRMRRAYDRIIAILEKAMNAKLPNIDPSSTSNYQRSIAEANHFLNSLKEKYLVDCIKAAKAEYEGIKLSEQEVRETQEYWKDRSKAGTA